jgi:molecular chaperone DnaJ
MAEDYYHILGVGKEATPEELKEAFKKMAMQYHPDRNKDQGAEERFKKVNEAYEVLKDPVKKKQYDQFGTTDGSGGFHDYGQQQGGFDFQNFGFDIFEAFHEFGFMGGGSRREKASPQPARGKDIEYKISINLEDAFYGKVTDIEYHRLYHCNSCSGSGVKNTGQSTCTTCNGSGRTRTIRGFTAIERTCYSCKGTGINTDSLCGGCKGEGRINKKARLSIKIPAGIEDGKKVRVKGEGDSGILGGTSGDFLLYIEIKQHKIFNVEGANLRTSLTVDFETALLGGVVKFKSIDGKEFTVNIPECLQTGTVLKVPEAGMSILNNSNTRGDLILECIIQIPKKLSSKQKEIMKTAFAPENKGGIFTNIF